jgi:hypothetical protein
MPAWVPAPADQLNDPGDRMEVAGRGLSLVWVVAVLAYVLVRPRAARRRRWAW